jgi:hypothetical protein
MRRTLVRYGGGFRSRSSNPEYFVPSPIIHLVESSPVLNESSKLMALSVTEIAPFITSASITH